ncbi:DUF881 domain-containing protein [Syntrophomonas curvata]
MRSKNAQISIAIVSLVLGIMLAIQFKTTASSNDANLPARVEDVAQKLDTVTQERDALAEEVVSLREKLSNVRKNDQAMADLQGELQKSNMMAGLTAVEGPGIILTVNDIPRIMQAGEDPNSYIVHDTDLQTLVNDLKASGAEAISINDQRITAMSEIRCASTLILVNTRRIGPPFVIKATGNPDMLESGMTIKGGWLGIMKQWGYQIQMQKAEKVQIPPYSGAIRLEYSGLPSDKEKAD